MSKKYGNLIKTQTTLIVAPASLLGQWENEVKTKVSQELFLIIKVGLFISEKVARPFNGSLCQVVTTKRIFIEI